MDTSYNNNLIIISKNENNLLNALLSTDFRFQAQGHESRSYPSGYEDN
jgi:hypothetical protein